MKRIRNVEELNEYMKEHGKDLYKADLSCANLSYANLSYANLKGVNLSCTDLRGANLSCADLSDANLRRANLKGADLRCASLKGANLVGANLDFSCWPLWCGSLKTKIDDRIAVQLLYYLCSTVMYSYDVSEEIKDVLLSKDVLEIANRFHKVNECGKLK